MGSATMLLVVAATLGFASASVENLPLGGEISQEESTCPDKWVDASFVEMGCLYFNSTQALHWDEANSMCQMGSNSTLLAITSEMQMAFIQMQLDVIADHDGVPHNWWTAGTDVGINGRWVWATTFADVEEYIWFSGGPSPPDNYNCLALYSSSDYLGLNTMCEQGMYSICQLK